MEASLPHVLLTTSLLFTIKMTFQVMFNILIRFWLTYDTRAVEASLWICHLPVPVRTGHLEPATPEST